MFGTGIFLIITGLIKKAVISDYISINYVDRIFDNPALYSGVENLLGVYGYALQIYCDFSGYSDMAIGIALLLGFHFNKNFDSPYKSASITEFWRRWHIFLSSWLRDYLYIPLGGNRKGKLRTYLNLLTTMTLGGLWHGASLRFILWEAIHGVSLSLNKLYLAIIPKNNILTAVNPYVRKIFGILFTFNLVCLCWIFFRADDMGKAINVINQIFTDFRGELILEVVPAYSTVFILVLIGYIFHFMPEVIMQKCNGWIIRAPHIGKAFLLILVIWLVVQIRTSEIVPFIYFRF